MTSTPSRSTSSAPTLSRRAWLLAILAVPASLAAGSVLRAAGAKSKGKTMDQIEIESFSSDGKSQGISRVAKIVKTDAEWKALLKEKSAERVAFDVTRHEGTERAGTGRYADTHDAGLYTCICCETALFDAATKFESGTGWPSFWQPVSKHNVAETEDNSFFMRRTAVSCARCDAHLGHVFPDGPRPTGLRYCMNSAALNFLPRA